MKEGHDAMGNPETTTETTMAIEERIAVREQEIARLNLAWRPYARVFPILPSAVGVGRYNPTRLIEKLRLAVAIDDATVALERDRAELARAQRAALDVAGEIAALDQARDEAEAGLVAARAAQQAASVAYRTAALVADGRRRRIVAAAAEIARAEAAARRWEQEGERERSQLHTAEATARVLDHQRAAEAQPTGVR